MKKYWILGILLFIMCIMFTPATKASAQDNSFYYTDETKDSYQNQESVRIGADADFSSLHTTDSYPLVKEITFEEGVTSLGRYVFYYFPNVTKVNIPMSLTQINSALNPNDYVFANNDKKCLTKLESFEVDERNTVYMSMNGVLYSKNQTRLICYPAAKKDTKYVIPEFVTDLEDVFGENPNLLELTIGTRVKWDDSLGHITLPNLKAFQVAEDNGTMTAVNGILYTSDMKKLLAYPQGKIMKKLVIPETVTDIGYKAFYGAQIVTVVLPPDLSYIDYSSDPRFEGNKFKAFSITNGTYLATEDGVVYNKDKTQLAIWPGRKTVTTLSFPSTLKQVNLMYGYIPQECLAKVTKLVIPKSATFMFYDGGLDALKTITIEKGNTAYSLYDGLLYSKDQTQLYLIPVKANKSTLTIPKAFQYDFLGAKGTMTSVKKIIVNGNGADFPYEIFPNLNTFALGKGNTKAKVISGVLYSANGKTLIWYPQAKTTKSFTVPSAVTAFADNAFAVQKYIETITLPKKLKITFDSVSTMFADCKKLKQIKVTSGNTYLTAVDGVLYTKDKVTLLCYPQAKTTKSFTLPDTVKNFCVSYNPYLTTLNLGSGFTFFYNLNSSYSSGMTEFTKLAKITVSAKNKEYYAIDGVLYRTEMEGKEEQISLYCYPIGKTAKTFTIPEDVLYVWYDEELLENKYLEELRTSSTSMYLFGKYVFSLY